MPACAIANAACACVRSVHRQFYKGLLVSEREEEVGQVARDVSLRPDEHGAVGAAPRGSDIRGPMLPALGERDVYLHFKHLQRQVDPHVAARLAFPKESHKVSVGVQDAPQRRCGMRGRVRLTARDHAGSQCSPDMVIGLPWPLMCATPRVLPSAGHSTYHTRIVLCSSQEREDRVARAFSGPQGAAVLRALEQASAVARAAVEKCAYHHVQLGSLFARMGMR